MELSSSSDKPIGRTGWDVLASSRFFILAGLVLVLLLVLSIAYPDGMRSIVQSVNGAIDAFQPYLLPLLAGAFLAHYVYDNYVAQYTLLLVWNGETARVGCYAFSKMHFMRVAKEHDPAPLMTTDFGSSIYLAKSYDALEQTIDFAYIHDAKLSPLEVFSNLASYHSLVKATSRLSLELAELKNLTEVKSVAIANDILQSEHEMLAQIIGLKNEAQEAVNDVQSS